MTDDAQSLPHEDLQRAAGVEKMARAVCKLWGVDPDQVLARNDMMAWWQLEVPELTIALAAWEAHEEERQAKHEKAPRRGEPGGA